MEADDTVKEGYVDTEFNEITQTEQAGLSAIGIVALALLLRLDDNQESPGFVDAVFQHTRPEVMKFAGKKLVEGSYVETRFDRETEGQQVYITEKGNELIVLLSFFTKDIK